jgi:hypothetical protein
MRVNRSGDACNARPCHNCLQMMKSVGIRKVYYSISNEEIVCEKVKDMVSIQASSVDRHLERLKGNPLAFDDKKYFDNLVKTLFPPQIKRYNLEAFIKYNLVNVLPAYVTKMETKKDFTIVIILNTKNEVVTKAYIV